MGYVRSHRALRVDGRLHSSHPWDCFTTYDSSLHHLSNALFNEQRNCDRHEGDKFPVNPGFCDDTCYKHHGQPDHNDEHPGGETSGGKIAPKRKHDGHAIAADTQDRGEILHIRKFEPVFSNAIVFFRVVVHRKVVAQREADREPDHRKNRCAHPGQTVPAETAPEWKLAGKQQLTCSFSRSYRVKHIDDDEKQCGFTVEGANQNNEDERNLVTLVDEVKARGEEGQGWHVIRVGEVRGGADDIGGKS